MVELVYKFDEKSAESVLKGKSTNKMSFKLFLGGGHMYIYIFITYLPRSLYIFQ